MKFNENFEKIFFIYSLENPKYLTVTRPEFFKNKELDMMAYLSRKFFEKFNEAPSSDQMKLLIDNSNRTKGKISDDFVNAVYKTNTKNYEKDWLRNTAESWVKWRNFDISLFDAVEFVKTTKVNPENVESVITKYRDIINNRNSLSFDTDLGLDFFNPEDHYQRLEDKIKSGRQFVDNLTGGGYDTCSLVVYAGEQNIGKCSTYSQYITLRNKKTNEITSIKIGDFFNRIKNQGNEKK